MARGVQIIRVMTQKDSAELINNLRESGFRATYMEAEGKDGNVHIIYSVVERSKFNSKAFYSVEDVRSVNPQSDMFVQEQKEVR